ncbi:MAG: class I poly(R)-hydroxyalkanoic acid synthase [Rhodospirillales bacterium]
MTARKTPSGGGLGPEEPSSAPAPAAPESAPAPAPVSEPAPELSPEDRFTEALQGLNERARRIAETAVQQGVDGGDNGFQMPDPGVISKAFLTFNEALTRDPARLMQAQADLLQGYARVFESAAKRLGGEDAPPAAAPAPGDKRFNDPAWSENPLFDALKQSYLVTSDWLSDLIEQTEGLDDPTRAKVRFYARQMTDALAPANFLATNPAALKRAADTKGETMLKGMDQFLNDLESGGGRLKISMTDESAFELGVNLAVTEGSVVFQNDLMQLIQYAPATKTVTKRPVLIVPPWINKYYVLDMQPENSLIKWMVGQGLTVFVISWVNPDSGLGHKTFDDYMLEGPIAALKAVEQATGEPQADIVGYCIGGTLTACALAWMQAKGERRAATATLLTTLLDFEDAGEISVFIDEEQLGILEKHMEQKGYLDGRHMAGVFNMLRDNDLIWSFVVNNYLMGRPPRAFDLLHWNADNTRMPQMMHRFYLREMYLNNKLKDPDGVTLAGVPVDLSKIETPVYMLAAEDDHIAPWRSAYAGRRLFGGETTFVLAGSGHIAGVVNPPDKNKYLHRVNPASPETPDEWLADAWTHEGSWWPHWRAWLAGRAGPGGAVKPRVPGEGGLKVIEPAPGSYVRVRADV